MVVAEEAPLLVQFGVDGPLHEITFRRRDWFCALAEVIAGRRDQGHFAPDGERIRDPIRRFPSLGVLQLKQPPLPHCGDLPNELSLDAIERVLDAVVELQNERAKWIVEILRAQFAKMDGGASPHLVLHETMPGRRVRVHEEAPPEGSVIRARGPCSRRTCSG